MYELIVFLPLLGFLIAGLFGPLDRRARRRTRHDAACSASAPSCPGSPSSWSAGTARTRIVPVANWFASGKLAVALGAAHRHADRRDAGRRDDRFVPRAPLFDRLHGARIRAGRASSPICRCSPSPC